MLSISVVTTLYNSEIHIAEFIERVAIELKKTPGNHEIVLVNDGSPDRSLEVAKSLIKDYPNLRVLTLSRNQGHHIAMLTAIQQARGDLVFAIDSDLEEPPEILGEFLTDMEENGVDVVYGVQEARKGGFFERLLGAVFYKVFNYFSGVRLPANLLMARLMSRRYVDALCQYREKSLFLGAVFVDVGFKQKALVVRKIKTKGTTYTLKKRLQLAVRAVTSFSYKPLRMIFYTGLTIWFFSSIYLVVILYDKLVRGSAAGWASLIASIWFLGGLMILFLGIIGMYLAVLFTEIKARPIAVYEVPKDEN